MENLKRDLKSMFTQHWQYLAVSAACELRLFDLIFESRHTLEELIYSRSWDLRLMKTLIEYLIDEEYIICSTSKELMLTEKGNLLRESNQDGLYYACLNWSGEHLSAWQKLAHTLKTGQSTFENLYHKPYFEYLNATPHKLKYYHKAMLAYAKDDYQKLPLKVDFAEHTCIMDVGGGYGAAIQNIKQTKPDARCILFDLPSVVEEVKLNDIEVFGGDFFIEIPNFSDAIILSRVIHDWNDEKASSIIYNCYQALPPSGKLYLIENCTDLIQNNLSLLTLNMAVMCESFERSATQYIELCSNQGFSFIDSKPLNDLQTILIFSK
jgi:hypothetical protein